MAEPAWVLRTRRIRTRRYHARGAAPLWFEHVPLMAKKVRRVLPGWFISLALTPLLRLMILAHARRTFYQALAARAVLEGLRSQEPDGWGQRYALHQFIDTPNEQFVSGTAHPIARPPLIPLRYAAHLVTLMIVAALVFASGASSWAGLLRLDTWPLPSSAGALSVDQRVRWAPSYVGATGENELAQPAVRVAQPQFEPAFVASHELVEGETLGELATRYRVSVASLFWANDLDRGGFLAAGQELRIPRMSGIPHVIQPGETLESIATAFHVTSQAITLFRANHISEDQPLPVGTEIFIPGGARPYPDEILARYGDEQGIATMVAVSAGVVRESDTNLRTGPGRAYPRVGYLDAGRRLKLIVRHGDWVKVDSGATGAGWVRTDLLGLPEATIESLSETNDFPPPPPRWVWPTRGEITSPFGWRSAPFRSFHDGVDIANATGTRIYAARAGRVIEAGWCSGFGYCVKIDHGEGFETIYGHMLKKPPVFAGNSVDAGDLIGYMGSTFDRSGGGYSTGVHLHFTVKINGKAVNPLKFLP
jgi:murein DD-endopeptidase MepM/ murein hydrolase activator NlpD